MLHDLCPSIGFDKREKSHSEPPVDYLSNCEHVLLSLAFDYVVSEMGKISFPTFCHMTVRCYDKNISDGMGSQNTKSISATI